MSCVHVSYQEISALHSTMHYSHFIPTLNSRALIHHYVVLWYSKKLLMPVCMRAGRRWQNFPPSSLSISLLIIQDTGSSIPLYLQSPAGDLHWDNWGRGNYESMQMVNRCAIMRIEVCTYTAHCQCIITATQGNQIHKQVINSSLNLDLTTDQHKKKSLPSSPCFCCAHRKQYNLDFRKRVLEGNVPWISRPHITCYINWFYVALNNFTNLRMVVLVLVLVTLFPHYYISALLQNILDLFFAHNNRLEDILTLGHPNTLSMLIWWMKEAIVHLGLHLFAFLIYVHYT